MGLLQAPKAWNNIPNETSFFLYHTGSQMVPMSLENPGGGSAAVLGSSWMMARTSQGTWSRSQNSCQGKNTRIRPPREAAAIWWRVAAPVRLRPGHTAGGWYVIGMVLGISHCPEGRAAMVLLCWRAPETASLSPFPFALKHWCLLRADKATPLGSLF